MKTVELQGEKIIVSEFDMNDFMAELKKKHMEAIRGHQED